MRPLAVRLALASVGLALGLACLGLAMRAAEALYLSRARMLYGPDYAFIKVDPLVNAKLDFFLRHKDEYTTLFIGDSLVYREIDPVRYDRALRSAGLESKSFNLGLSGMRVFEAHFLLRLIARMRPLRLHRVIVGTSYHPRKGETADFFRKSLREVYWRDLDETAREISSHLDSSEPPAPALKESGEALAMFLSRGARLAVALSPFSRPPRHGQPHDLKLEDDQGFLPLELDHGDNRRAEYLAAGSAGFASDLALFSKEEPPQGPPFAPRYAGFQAIRHLAREQGWALTFVRPFFDSRSIPTGCEAADAGCSLLDFGDTKRYASFYRYDRYYDFYHLNHAAAEEFTALIARQMTPLEAARK